jgi:hypothetical protein
MQHRSPLLDERSPSSRPRWVRPSSKLIPWSRVHTYKRIYNGDIVSVLVGDPGKAKKIRLIDLDSVDAYLERLALEQRAAKQV